jgi:PAS domain S-box-containing protein
MRMPQSDTRAAQNDSMKSGRYPLLSLKLRSWIPYAVFGGALIVTFVAALYVHRTAQAKDRARFENSVRQVSTTLQNRLDTHVALLRAGTGLFAASTTVEPDEFHKFVNQLDLPNHYPGIQGIGFSLKLSPDERKQRIEQMRKAGNPDFRIWPEGDRSEYHTIIYLEPSDRRNQAAIGFDMTTEPVRRAAMERARDTGAAVASGRVTLVQEIENPKQPGFLIYAPVYRNGAKVDTIAERRAQLEGFVYAAFRSVNLFPTILAAHEYHGIDFQVFDGAKAEAAELLYDSAPRPNDVVSASRFGSTTTIPVADSPWSLHFTTNSDFEIGSATNFATFTLFGGGLLSLILFWVTRSQTQAQNEALSAARELKHSENSLRKSLEEQKQTAAALRESEEILRLANYRFRVAEGAAKSFHYDWNLDIDKVVRSESFTKVLGYGLNEVADTWEAWKLLIHPDDFPLSKHEAIESLNQLTEDNFEVEYRVRHKDGHYCDLYNRGIVLRDDQGKVNRVIGQTVDVTERKLAEDRLRAANERAIVEYERLLERIAVLAQKLGAARELLAIYRALLEFARASAPCNGLFVSLYDSEQDVRAAAYGWGDGSEFDVTELPPMPVTKQGPNSRAVRTGNVIITDDFMNTTSGHPQVLIGPDDGTRPQSSMAVPMSVMGKVVGTIELQSYERQAYKPEHATAMRMAANLTAVAIENAQLLARESQARAEAEESNRLKDEFLATVSHELRTPLTAILGWARMLESDTLAEAQAQRAIQTIQRNAKAQAEIIDDILDVSRIVTGNLYLNLEPTELAPIVEAAINVVRPTAEAKHIQIETNFADQPALVSADAHRLQQVVWNLLSNAVKFTPQGGHVRVTTRQTGPQVHLEICDNGQGISAEFLPHVFERFRQADSSTTRKHGGLGLGLAIVRHLVEIHGGTVRAQSDGEGKGATLTVILPSLADDDSVSIRDDEKEISSALRTDQPELEGIHVLLVDDDAGTREMISAALNERHARVTAVASAREALQVIRRTRPDVLVSDIAMPIEDGYDLIEQIRALESNNGKMIPAVAITAYAREEDRRRALASGFQSYLAKPIEPADLIDVVASLTR